MRKRGESLYVILVVVTCILSLGGWALGQESASKVNSPTATPSQPLSDKDAALLDAAFAGDLTELEQLIADGANVNGKDASGLTPLLLAAYQGHTEVVRFLLTKGADAAATDEHGQTSVLHAQQKGHTEVVALLEKASGPPMKLMGAPVLVFYGATPIKTKYYDIHYDPKRVPKGHEPVKTIIEEFTKHADDGYDLAKSLLYYGISNRIQISFYNNSADVQNAYADGLKSSIYINLARYYDASARYPSFDFKTMVKDLTHETVHVLFDRNAGLKAGIGGYVPWGGSSKSWYWYTFITETLAYYAGDVLSPYGPQLKEPAVREKLQKLTSLISPYKLKMETCGTFYKPDYAMSWYEAGKIYRDMEGGAPGQKTTRPSNLMFDTAQYTIYAAGFFLAEHYKGCHDPGWLIHWLRTTQGLHTADGKAFEETLNHVFHLTYMKNRPEWDPDITWAKLRDPKNKDFSLSNTSYVLSSGFCHRFVYKWLNDVHP